MELLDAEHALQQAQRDGDVDALDRLLHPSAVGVGPDGTAFSREDDLGSYRSGFLRVTSLTELDVEVQDDGPVGVTRTLAQVEAVQGGQAMQARLRYTRFWVRQGEDWQVLAARFGPE